MEKITRYEDIRNRMFSIYAMEIKNRNNDKNALELTQNFLETFFDEYPHKTLGKRFKSGLKTEILFYSEYKKKFNLQISSTRIDKYFKIDFAGIDPITKQKIYIDVTKNISTKLSKIDKFQEVIDDIRFFNESFEYRIAHFDYDSLDCDMTPLMLPIHPDGYLGFNVLTLEKDRYDLFGQLIVIYLDPKNPIEIMDHESILSYKFYNQSELDEIYCEIERDLKEEIEDSGEEPFFEEDFSKKVENIVHEIITDSRQDLFKFIRSEVDIVLSSIIEPRYFYDKPRDFDYNRYYTTWVHPIPTIKKIFGNILNPLDDIDDIELLYF